MGKGFYVKRRVDANQARIVRDLRAAGASVEHLHTIGHGVPDLLVGFRGVNHLLEVKDPTQPLSKRVLTDAEHAWHQTWHGRPVVIVEDSRQAFVALGMA